MKSNKDELIEYIYKEANYCGGTEYLSDGGFLETAVEHFYNASNRKTQAVAKMVAVKIKNDKLER